MIVVVSPHLDDAALSVPCWLATRAEEEEVVVLTVFSEGDAGYEERRAEDVAALAVLGVRAVHVGLLDAPFRRGVERSFRGLVLAELAVDDADACEVGREICGWVAALRPEVVVLPLGVGEHIDHRVVHAAHAGIAGRVGFYEDRPYAWVSQAVRARLARLGATVDGVGIAGSRAAAEEFMVAAREAPHVRAYLPADEREACLEPLAAALVAPSAPSGLVLRGEEHGFEPPCCARAVRAVQVYASQVTDLFGGASAVAGAYAADRYVERVLWRGGPATPTTVPGV